MKKTLLLVFIHGFKGDDTTFLDFPSQLKALLSHALPATINVTTAVYPAFDTRGDLSACVLNFREWLTNTVIDLEVAQGTPSPTVEPGVRVIIIGHSMGGIVGAEALLGIARDAGDEVKPTASAEVQESKEESEKGGGLAGGLMFPYVQGLLAFDTPYLGIAPGVVAHGAEGHFSTGKSLYETATGLFGAKAAKDGTAAAVATEPASAEVGVKALPPPEVVESSAATTTATNTSSSPPKGWQSWGKYAAIAGAASVVAAGAGAAAYWKKDTIATGWGWVGSHLEFIGTLARGEELKQRLEGVVKVGETRGVGFANLYTCLGQSATGSGGHERTFCSLPKSEVRSKFLKAVNEKATDETTAHMVMFDPKQNPGFYAMGHRARELIVRWVSSWRGSEASTSNRTSQQDEPTPEPPADASLEAPKVPDRTSKGEELTEVEI